jgi:hypothetical protein
LFACFVVILISDHVYSIHCFAIPHMVVLFQHLNLIIVFVHWFTELQHLRNSLPDEVVVQRVEERLSALGNCVVCNDHVALIHTDLDRVCAYLYIIL